MSHTGAGISTVKLYRGQLRKYGHLDFNNPREVMKKLSEATNTRGRPLSPSYIKGIISAIVWKIRQDDKDNPILDDYRHIIAHIRGKIERESRTNKKVSGHLPDWEDIVRKRDEEYRAGRLKNHLILSLYTYTPPRRILDYLMLKIVRTPNEANDVTYNYYITSKKSFVYNVYKTAKKYKQQIIKAPPTLHKIITNYVTTNGIKNGELLLGFRNYLQLNYLLKKLLGCGVDNIRHSYINHAYKNFNIPTNEFMSDLAEKMGHSVETNLMYRKF